MSHSLSDINGILSLLISKARMTEAELAREINIPRATINRLTSGKTPDPRASTLNAIAAYFNISVEQLIGKKPLLDNSQEVISSTSETIPVIELNKALEWETLIPQLTTSNHFDFILIDPSTCQGKFAIKVQGESMWPQFQVNTLLIISTDKIVKNRDYVLAYVKETNEIVFRQMMIDGTYKFLQAINSLFPSITFTNEDKVIGTVIQTRLNLD